jgi:hypothetical protein
MMVPIADKGSYMRSITPLACLHWQRYKFTSGGASRIANTIINYGRK